MYEILFDIPPNQNPGAAPDQIYNLVDVIVSNVCKVNFLNIHTKITILVGR